MSKLTVTKTNLEVNKVESTENYWFFTYDLAKLKLKIPPTDIATGGKTETKWNLFAATTEHECIDEILKLGLTGGYVDTLMLE